MSGKVLVGYPHNGCDEKVLFSRSCKAFMQYDWGKRKLSEGFIDYGGFNVLSNRNELVHTFLGFEPKCDLFWMLDSDMAFRPDALYKLYDHIDEEHLVVTAYYNGYINPPKRSPTWFLKNELGYTLFDNKIDEGGLYELDACGLGCILVHRKVFEKIALDYPNIRNKWFSCEDISPNLIPSFDSFTFCERVIKAGFKIWGLGYQVGHCKLSVI